jgi:hypothetical protein
MENGEWELPLPLACGKNLCSIHTLGFEVRCLIHHALFVVWIPGEKQPHVKNSKTFHEKFSPFSKNGPSAIQGERATSPFSILREWEERGDTTPNVMSNDLVVLHRECGKNIHMNILN